jgi:hypothetical protein
LAETRSSTKSRTPAPADGAGCCRAKRMGGKKPADMPIAHRARKCRRRKGLCMGDIVAISILVGFAFV